MSRDERRRSPRVVPRADVARRARVVGGADALVLNVSRQGACVESTHRTAPGRRLVLTWPGVSEAPRVTMRVLRVTVAALAGEAGVIYRVALELDPPQPRLWELATREG